MASKTSFFNATLLRRTIARFWPLWAAYLGIWFIAIPVSISSRLGAPYANIDYVTGELIFDMAGSTGTWLSLFFGVLTAMAVFGYLCSARSASGIAALPIRREGVFLTQFSAGFLCMLLANVVVFFAAVVVEAAYGVLFISPLLQWLAIVSMLNAFFYGFAVLCAMLTGSLLILPLVYMVLNFVVAVVEYVGRLLLCEIVFGMPSSGTTLDFLSPAYFLGWRAGAGQVYDVETGRFVGEYFFNAWTAVGIYFAVGILMAVLALALYRRRRMEAAGDVVAVKPLKPVFKYCMSFGSALVLGALIYSIVNDSGNVNGIRAYAVLLVCTFIGGIIGYFAGEMLIRKSLRVFKSSFKGGIAALAVILLVLTACEFDLFGYERKLPELANIRAVEVRANGEWMTFEGREGVEAALELQKSVVQNKTHHESAEQTAAFWLTWLCKDGSVQSRNYRISASPEEYETPGTDIWTLGQLANSREAVEFRKSVSVATQEENISYAYVDYFDAGNGCYSTIELTAGEAYALYTECILPDIEDGALGKVWLVTTEEYYRTVCSASIQIGFQETERRADGSVEYYADSFYTVPTAHSHRTNAWLEEHGVHLVLQKEYEATYASPAAVDVYGYESYDRPASIG